MKARFDRAISVIWLDLPLIGCIGRYVWRCLKFDANRPGRLEGATSEFSWSLIWHTLWNYPKARRKYRNILAYYPDLSVYVIKRFSDVKKLSDLSDLSGKIL